MNIPVKVVPNFLPLSDCERWIQLINKLETDRPSDFIITENEENYRIALQFGEKDYEDESPRPTLEILGDSQAAAQDLFSRIEKCSEQEFGIGKLFTSVFWLAKQYPGSKVGPHEDTDEGADSHLAVSSLVYLNSQTSGGQLSFPDLNYVYTPQAGDLVMFDTVAAGVHAVEVINEERYSLPLWMTRDESFKL
jgi:hypothetical protein